MSTSASCSSVSETYSRRDAEDACRTSGGSLGPDVSATVISVVHALSAFYGSDLSLSLLTEYFIDRTGSVNALCTGTQVFDGLRDEIYVFFLFPRAHGYADETIVDLNGAVQDVRSSDYLVAAADLIMQGIPIDGPPPVTMPPSGPTSSSFLQTLPWPMLRSGRTGRTRRRR